MDPNPLHVEPTRFTRFFGLVVVVVVLARGSERDEVNFYSTSMWLGKLIDLEHLQKFLSPLLILIFSKIKKKNHFPTTPYLTS